MYCVLANVRCFTWHLLKKKERKICKLLHYRTISFIPLHLKNHIHLHEKLTFSFYGNTPNTSLLKVKVTAALDIGLLLYKWEYILMVIPNSRYITPLEWNLQKLCLLDKNGSQQFMTNDLSHLCVTDSQTSSSIVSKHYVLLIVSPGCRDHIPPPV